MRLCVFVADSHSSLAPRTLPLSDMRRCIQCFRVYEDGVQFCPRDGTALPPPDTLIGRVLDNKYRIDALQGLGGMGAVYRGTQLNLDRTVAVKIVKGDFLEDEQVTERFRREALAVGRLNHSNIVTVYDFGVLPDVGAYLVMEFLQGRTLRQELKEEGRIELERATELMLQACSAVYAAHVEGIIHRDLKPDNVFLQLTIEGDTQVKILDFGVAKFTGVPDPLGHELTLTGMVIGTPVYMSPEQCQGEELDLRTDIYSLGCVFFEMLAGRPPFSATTSSAIVVKHATEPPPPLTNFVDVPRRIEAAILKALAKKPEDRFQSAAELAVAIEEAMARRQGHGAAADEDRDEDRRAPAPDDRVGQLVEHLFPSHANDDRPRVAVLPFNNVTREPGVAFLGYALADAMITELSCEPFLVVRPSSAVTKYVDEHPDTATARTELDVDLMVQGSFLKEGNQFQLNVQMVELDKNAIVWQQRITTKYENSISLQQEVVHQIVEGLCSRLNIWHDTHTHTGEHAVAAAAERDPVSVELLERARALGDAASERAEAIELLERAVALDPDYAEAWSALASRYYDESQQVDATTAEADLAVRSAERALAIDRGQLGSVVALGRMLVEAGGAEELARRAATVIREEPERAGAHYALGYAFRFGGLLDLALREFRRARAIGEDRVSEELAAIYIEKGLHHDALRVLEGAGRLPALFLKAVAESLTGQEEAARETARVMGARDPLHVRTAMARALVEPDSGSSAVDALADIKTGNSEVHCWLAQIYAARGRSREAVERLRDAIDGGYFNAPFLESSPMLASIRGDAGAREVLARARRRHELFAKEFAGE